MAGPESSSCSRRAALGVVGSLCTALVLAACGDGGTAPIDDGAVTVDAGLIVIRVDRVDALRRVGGALVLGRENVIVLRVADADYRAFTNICTHAGCGITRFAGERMICPCHGSEYDIDGVNVAGPAPLPLRRYAATYDAVGRTLRIATA